ncbi:hypothetical protein [Burkholderia ubonensis]|nr:hypothetical protein [Burkholderia ubonensis]
MRNVTNTNALVREFTELVAALDDDECVSLIGLLETALRERASMEGV